MTESKKFRFGWVLWVIVLSILLIALFIYLNYRKSSKNRKSGDLADRPVQEFNTDYFISEVKKQLSVNDITSKLITALSLHETGIFTSDLFVNHNNAFSMRYPEIRDTYASSKTDAGFSHYDTIQDSIKDFGLWAAFNSMNLNDYNNTDDFVYILKDKKYFEAPYISYLAAFNK